MTGRINTELARALKERLQVTSGDDNLRVLPDGSMENTVLSCLTGRALLASSITWARLSLSITGSGSGETGTGRGESGWDCDCCCNLPLRSLRATSPREGESSCADADNEYSSTRSSKPSGTAGATQRKLGSGDCMISVAEQHIGTQRVHTKSLGELERKRSYRRDTAVLALPCWERVRQKRMGKGHERALRSKQRATGRGHALSRCCLQQARGTKTGDRIGYPDWLPLKNPACHRNPQCRVCQMPDFHSSLPTPNLGEKT